MDAKTIQEFTGVSQTTIYNEKLHEKSNSELIAWIKEKLPAVKSKLKELDNARVGYERLLQLLEGI